MQDKGSLASLQKAIAILKFLSYEPYHFTAIEISKGLNINRSTVHRMLATLMEEMMVLQNPITKKYKLGPLSYHIGASYLHNMKYVDEIHNIIDGIAEKLSLSVGYAVKEGNKIMTLYEVEDYVSVRMGYKPGSFYPINCGAYGKTIMAFHKPLDELRRIVYSTPLEKRSEKTITNPDKLLKEYEKIRMQGYSISNGENLKGALGVGAPVKNSKGDVIACVAAAGIKASIDQARLKEIKAVVIDGANKISSLIP
ncbi:IclR family transcriptional regulator [Alkaliphilus pronyensis]|uniref:IclR family transcriptional regulator n=1 Tax=Alkaliphilus pronyensis TaxID=1482732 RepID=A0A6I0F7K0_9FIRM|nr:IclR family transcriptional regulator [Alkaliphilus pronyensis]KAB3534365.1 IclR family transcriptional regulator [Alkaliphilus pronyensis]